MCPVKPSSLFNNPFCLSDLTRRLSSLTFALLCALGTASADDIDVFQEKICTVGTAHDYRFIFIVDNSGSMSGGEFNQSKETIDASIKHVIDTLDDVEVAVVQYGSSNSGDDHDYVVTVPFTSDPDIATVWGRAYGGGGDYQPSYNQDHQPASLAKMRTDNVYDPGGALDITDGTNVQFVFFTDALRDYTAGCCSSLVADARTFIPATVLPGFGEYDALKTGAVLPGGLPAQFTVLSANSDVVHQQAAAAIASVGGSYTGAVENYATDPDGPGATPRRFVAGSLSPTDTNEILAVLDDVFEEIAMPPATESDSFTQVSIDINLASLSSDNRAFFALFAPTENRAWRGNIKGYFLGDGMFTGLDGIPAITNTPAGAVLSDTAKSFWTAGTDGTDVLAGGFNENIATGSRNLLTWLGDSDLLFDDSNLLSTGNLDLLPSLFDLATVAERDDAINWLQQAPVGDSLHSGPQLVRYASGDVLYAMTNQGLLHAINATNPITVGDAAGGGELWAFMPQELLANLPLLSATPTVGSHIYGLDGGMTRWHEDHNGDGIINGIDSMYLIIGQRRGGNNYYALDITNPTAPEMVWHIEGGDTTGFGDLAQSWSRPSLVTVQHTGTPLSPTADPDTDRVLVFTGGYDAVMDDRTDATTGLGGAVFMVDRTGDIVWSTENSMLFSMPSDIAILDTNADGLADRMYVGDTGGQIWRITFDDTKYHSQFDSVLFASLGNADFQPFFYQPDIALIDEPTENYLAITIGSGNRDNPLDTLSENRLYMLKDPAIDNTDITTPSTIYATDLYDITDFDLGSSDVTTRTEARQELRDADGWYLELRTGEKVLSGVRVIEGKLMATTFLPIATGDVEGCTGAFTTQSSLYIMDIATGNPVELLGESESSELTAENRRVDIGSKGIPSSPQPVFSVDTGDIDILVDKDNAAKLQSSMNKLFWYEKK